MLCHCGGYIMVRREREDNPYGVYNNMSCWTIPREYIYCKDCDEYWSTIEKCIEDCNNKRREKMLNGLHLQIHRTEFEIIEVDPKDERFKDCATEKDVLNVVIDKGVKGYMYRKTCRHDLFSKYHTLIESR